MKSSGVTLEEIQILFKALEESKSNDSMQILIDNDMCKQLQNIIEGTCIYKDKEIERLKAREQECIDKYLVESKYRGEIEGKYVLAKYVIDELEKWLEEQREFIQTIDMMPNLKEIKLEHKIMFNDYNNVLDKLKELKEGKE